ncbi:MAG: hypothetical protein FWE74_04535, partial [Oscillospiraceae bacterium]|nr:hypothetical protein [Oscillospiraceae bacterium]
MNRIANDFKMQMIDSAIPLHERKAKSEKEERELTFEEKLKNAVISHVTGADLSGNEEDTEATALTEE